MKLAEEFNVAVYLTNQVVSDPGGAMTFVQDPKASVSRCKTMSNVQQGSLRLVHVKYFFQRVSVCVSVCLFSLETNWRSHHGSVE